jgi:hypothetical protein
MLGSCQAREAPSSRLVRVQFARGGGNRGRGGDLKRCYCRASRGRFRGAYFRERRRARWHSLEPAVPAMAEHDISRARTLRQGCPAVAVLAAGRRGAERGSHEPREPDPPRARRRTVRPPVPVAGPQGTRRWRGRPPVPETCGGPDDVLERLGARRHGTRAPGPLA